MAVRSGPSGAMRLVATSLLKTCQGPIQAASSEPLAFSLSPGMSFVIVCAPTSVAADELARAGLAGGCAAECRS